MDQLEYLIDRKVTGSITASESDHLEQLIENQPNLTKEIKNRYVISNAIRYAGNEELRTFLKRIHREEFPQRGTPKVINIKTFMSIASIFVIGVSSYIFLMTESLNEISGGQIYSTYYEPYKASFQNRGDASQIAHNKFKNAYTKGQYSDALGFITEEMEIKNHEILLTMGISALEAGDFTLAKKHFRVIIKRNDYFFADHAKWYMAMISLKEENIAEAIDYLKDLSYNSQADHNQEAKELLKQIK